MRIIAIGLGGAGCRIADSLYATDRRSSKVACVQALAIDVDERTIQQLGALPGNARLCYSALDPGIPDSPAEHSPTATVDIAEIVSRVQNFESGETDAIFLCCGLGGGLVDIAPHIIAGLRSTVVEPIFGLVTLPCLAEGERISGKAADDIETLSPLLDGIILFDNETWHKKIKSEKARLRTKEKGLAEKIGLRKTEKVLSPSQEIYTRLNEAIVRRISLILRAGEFKADGGIDLAEVVLDSGEVLNTMKGMGFITIGYSVERLPHEPFGFLSRWKPAGLFDEDQKKKASRIVELAKQAIYHEISTPCDMTSAHKALILVAGPSHELSMKGFMTVRKWIDRSIAGLETRSGDYPVMNTKNVAIIIMLSGLENIPRITELREIRSQYNLRDAGFPELPTLGGDENKENAVSGAYVETNLKDDMIVLPERKPSVPETSTSFSDGSLFLPGNDHQQVTWQSTHGEEKPLVNPDHAPVSLQKEPLVIPQPPRERYKRPDPLVSASKDGSGPTADDLQSLSRRRVLVTHEQEKPAHSPMPPHHPKTPHSDVNRKPGIEKRELPEQGKTGLLSETKSRDTERQRIERELLRQRMVAISGPAIKKASPLANNYASESGETRNRVNSEETRSDEFAHHFLSEPGGDTEGKKTIIRSKRSLVKSTEDTSGIADKKNVENEPTAKNVMASSVGISSGSDRESTIGIRDQKFRAKDAVFEGRGVHRSQLPPVRDSTLLHTDIKQKKRIDETRAVKGEPGPSEIGSESEPLQKSRGKSKGTERENS